MVLLDVETSTAKDTLRRPSTGTPGPRHSSLPLHGIKLQERKVQSSLTHCRSHRIAPYHHRHSLVERPLALVVVPYREETGSERGFSFFIDATRMAARETRPASPWTWLV